jgi:putative membrane protein
MPEFTWLVEAFPNFVRYVVVGFALAGLFLWIYALVTPWREYTLIRAGNSAAATALIGALLGFCLPLANTIAHSVSIVDVLLWSLVALVVQVGVHIVLRLLMPDLKRAIEANEAAAGISAGGFAACFGLINAACLTT